MTPPDETPAATTAAKTNTGSPAKTGGASSVPAPAPAPTTASAATPSGDNDKGIEPVEAPTAVQKAAPAVATAPDVAGALTEVLGLLKKQDERFTRLEDQVAEIQTDQLAALGAVEVPGAKPARPAHSDYEHIEPTHNQREKWEDDEHYYLGIEMTAGRGGRQRLQHFRAKGYQGPQDGFVDERNDEDYMVLRIPRQKKDRIYEGAVKNILLSTGLGQEIDDSDEVKVSKTRRGKPRTMKDAVAALPETSPSSNEDADDDDQ